MGIKFNLVKPNNQIETIDLSDHYLEKGTAVLNINDVQTHTLDSNPINETVKVVSVNGETNIVNNIIVNAKPKKITTFNADRTISHEIALPNLTTHFPNGLGRLPNGVYDSADMKRLGRVLLNGSEAWSYGSTNGTIIRFNLSGIPTNSNIHFNDTDKWLNDRFLNGASEVVENLWISNTNTRITIDKSNLVGFGGFIDGNTSTYLPAFKAWLSANNVSLYYQLATPIPTGISLPSVPTYPEGHIEIDEGRMSLEIPVDITAQVNSNTNHIHTIKSGLNQFVKQSDVDSLTLALEGKLDKSAQAFDAGMLGGKLPDYYLNASNLKAGKVLFDRLPVGTSSDKVAAGNHTHSGYVQSVSVGGIGYMPDNGVITLPAYNPQSLTVKQNGETLATYDGSSAETVNIEGYTLTPLRTRAETTSLTSVASGDTVGSVPLSSTVGRGDTLLIELNTISSYTYSHKYIMVTLGTDSASPNSTSGYRNFSFSTFNGTDFNIYSFTVSASGSTLYFGSKKNLNGVFSGTTIAWTTADYTLYVGKVWKVN